MKTFTAIAAALAASMTAAAAGAAGVTISANGSTGPVVTVTVGTTVNFAANVVCNDELAVVAGTVQPKKGGTSSEVEWSFTNTTAATIRLTGFGLSWNCVSDPGGVCASWLFDYIKFGSVNGAAIPAANKIYKSARNPDPFPVTTFDRNIGGPPYDNPWLDVAAGDTVGIDEFEMVDPTTYKKIDPVPAGTTVEFTVTWKDSTGKTYPQTLTVTW